MTGHELRDRFLRYFERNGHTIVRSSPLVPANDPTLLFTNAGMVQFKGVFLGEERRDYVRATTCQKCVRAGGKHNDLENVGRTARHHTFFEMLGNFSFGDYFKAEAVAYAWEFLTRDLALPTGRLWATVFTDDDEASELWKSYVPSGPDPPARREGQLLGDGGHRALRALLGGPLPPGRPHPVRRGGRGRPCLGPACECDRWLEIWNLVFMQFDRDASGTAHAAPQALDRHRHGARADRRGRAGEVVELRHRSAPAADRRRRAPVRQGLRGPRGGRRLDARHRRPRAGDGVPHRRPGLALERVAGLRPPADHAPGDAARPPPRAHGAVPLAGDRGRRRADGGRLSGARRAAEPCRRADPARGGALRGDARPRARADRRGGPGRRELAAHRAGRRTASPARCSSPSTTPTASRSTSPRRCSRSAASRSTPETQAEYEQADGSAARARSRERDLRGRRRRRARGRVGLPDAPRRTSPRRSSSATRR